MDTKKTSIIALTAALLGISLLVAKTDSTAPYETDTYGGNMAIKSEATGFFRIEKINGQHIFITPEGHGFVSIGLNHFHHSERTDYDEMVSELKTWGFTAGCYQTPESMFERFPYTSTINFLNLKIYDPAQKFYYEDVFSPEFDRNIEDLVKKKVVPQVNNKMLIGYFMSNVPLWTKGKFGKTWITFYKSLDPESPGGKVWAKWKAENPDKDENDFVLEIADVVYKKGTEMIRKYDPNHLIFSDKYHEEDFPEEVILTAVPYVDAIATQTISNLSPEFFEIFNKAGKPLYLGDHTGGFSDEAYPNPNLPTEEEYLEYYREYMDELFDYPCVIGYNKCQYNDHSSRPGSAKRGIVDKDGKPHSYVVNDLRGIYLEARQKVYDRILEP